MQYQCVTHKVLPCIVSVFLSFVAALSLLSISVAHAQDSDNPFHPQWATLASQRTYALAWADVDGDGDLDLALGNNGSPAQLYRNVDGQLEDTPIWSAEESSNAFDIAWGDVDNDGDPDLALANNGQPSRLYRNDNGVMSVRATWETAQSAPFTSLAWADVDGDGNLDLALGSDEQPVSLYLNTNGTLATGSAWQAIISDPTIDIAWGDVDNDGDPDLAVGNNGKPSRIYRNCARQQIGNQCQTSTLLSLDPLWESSEQETIQAVAWGDIDGNGALDLLTAGIDEPVRVYYNSIIIGVSMLPQAASWATFENDDSWSMALGDYDSDGDLDLATGNVEDPIRVFENQDGVLTRWNVWSSNGANNTTAVAWGDVDGDGDIDLAVANSRQPSQVYQNTLVPLSAKPRDGLEVLGMAWGDVDADGDPDLALANYEGPLQVFRNKDGTLVSPPIWTTNAAPYAWGVAWGDLDNDGDQDLAVANNGSANQLYRNDDGNLTATPVWQASDSNNSLAVAWGDLDKDGDLDLAVANDSGQPNKIYRNCTVRKADDGCSSNDTTLTRTPIWQAAVGFSSSSVAWADINNDSFLDLVVGNYTAPSEVFVSQSGELPATPTWRTPSAPTTRSVALGDVDGDGDADLALGNEVEPNQVYRNCQITQTGDSCSQGSLFSAAPIWQASRGFITYDVAWGDVDADGDLDLAVGNELSGRNQIYRNCHFRQPDDGCAADDLVSSEPVWTAPADDYTRAVAWADVDGDGDADLASGNRVDPSRLLRSCARRQLDDGCGEADAIVSTEPVWEATTSDNTLAMAWGDYDNDGDLDLVTGNGLDPNRLYRNDEGQLLPIWEAPRVDDTTSVAWGDYDNDHDLDLAVGNYNSASWLYRNEGGVFTTVWTTAITAATTAVAWGDVDSDGDLDLALANEQQPSTIYLNDNGNLRITPGWMPSDNNGARDLAWGDYDSDGDLDLAVGNRFGPNHVYRNDSGFLTAYAVWSSSEASDRTWSVAWADVDGDGDLDLAAGNDGQPNRLYRNDNGTLTTLAVWSSAEIDFTREIAWGDVDGDGDLDLAVGNRFQASRLYRNDGGSLTSAAVWSSPRIDLTFAVSWVDVENDGDLDLATGNYGAAPRLYLNQQNRQLGRSQLPAIRTEQPLAQPRARFFNTALRLDQPTIPISFTLFQPNGQPVQRVIGEFSLDGGDNWRPAVFTTTTPITSLATFTPGPVITTGTTISRTIPPSQSLVAPLEISATSAISDIVVWLNVEHPRTSDLFLALVSPSGRTALLAAQAGGTGANFTDTFFDDTATTPIALGSAPFRGSFRPEGRLDVFAGEALQGSWHLLVLNTSATNGGRIVSWGITATTKVPSSHTVTWDVLQSGIMGQSDNVIFRLTPIAAAAAVGPGGLPALSLYKPIPATTYAFPVRGNQVRVVANGIPAGNALVYHQPANMATGGLRPYSTIDGRPFTTNAAGFLQGRGQLALGDQLVALLPITATESYSLYFTSAPANAISLTTTTVRSSGVQTLTVSPDHVLMLLNLDVSLEWDARADEQFLARLRADLERTSELLFDWTDGQVALGDITVYHDRQKWNTAHIRIYATNRLRPNANQGGIVSEVITDPVSLRRPDPLTPTVFYEPGQLRMGAVWNRYGEPGGNLGEDWPRTLAHELGHFALFLDDNYIGLSEQDQLVTIDSCPGAMSDPYADDESEFHPTNGWLSGCANTLSNRSTGRADWATIKALYDNPALNLSFRQPATFGENPGPRTLPLAVTRVRFDTSALVSPTQALDVPIFFFRQDGAPVTPGPQARAFLFRGDRLVDLGGPVRGELLARGAQPGDRLCVYDPAPVGATLLGCEQVRAGDEQIALTQALGWEPDLLISPVTSTTINLDLHGVPAGLALTARLFPAYVAEGDPVSYTVALTPQVNGYSGSFLLTAEDPGFEGYIHIFENGAEQPERREIVSAYTIGGNPGRQRKAQTPDRDTVRGNPGRQRKAQAPTLSSDGQVMLYNNRELPPGAFYALQSTSELPTPPAWVTLVGQAYRLTKSASAPPLDDGTASINVSYLGSDVPPGEEDGIQVYFLAEGATNWLALTTTLSLRYNEASALTRGPGLYALMSSVQVPLRGSGWNLVAYPIKGSRDVHEALRSIDGYYTTVYGYVGGTAEPWQVYDVDAPAWVNNLDELHYGQGYWLNIRATTPLTLYLRGSSAQTVGIATLAAGVAPPPATYYAELATGAALGNTVTAEIDGVRCATTLVERLDNGQARFKISVPADDEVPGCGAPGRAVLIRSGSTVYQIPWDNRRVWRLAPIYLPFVPREGAVYAHHSSLITLATVTSDK